MKHGRESLVIEIHHLSDMKNKPATIINEYNDKKSLYEELGGVVYSLLQTLIKSRVHTHQISYRVKGRESLSNKIVRKNYKYNSLDEITDIVGLRVILFFEDDIIQVERIIRQEFLIDESNSVDKGALDTDKFGYRSLHYVVSMNEKRLELPEYQKFRSMKFEIQIRSILQHSWAEIEHDIGYKGESEIPHTARRTFYRIAALLEQADLEFVKLKNELNEHEAFLGEQMISRSKNLHIDKASLRAFILGSKVLRTLEMEITEIFCPRDEHFYPPIIDNLLPQLKDKGIETIQELEKRLDKHGDEIKERTLSMKKDNQFHYNSFFQGASIKWLLDVMDKIH